MTSEPEKYEEKWTFSYIAQNLGFENIQVEAILDDYHQIINTLINSKPRVIKAIINPIYSQLQKNYSKAETETAKNSLQTISPEKIETLIMEGNFLGLFMALFNQGEENNIAYEFFGFIQKAADSNFNLKPETLAALEKFKTLEHTDQQKLDKVASRKLLSFLFS